MASETLSTIWKRHSVRRYQSKAVPMEMVEQMLEAAGRAPSAHNRQPWRFAVITAAETKQLLAKAMGRRLREDLAADGLPRHLIKADAERSYRRLTGAPVLILVCLSMEDMDQYPDPKRQSNELTMAVQSAAMAGQNLLLAAHASGLGACWMCAPLFCPEVVSLTLDLPNEWLPQGLITLGYPAEVRSKSRRPVSELTICFE